MAVEPSSSVPKMRCFASVFLVTTFIVGAIAGPWPQQTETECASVCTENNKFHYDVGTTYVYRYEGDIDSGVDVNKDNARLRIRAKVEIQPKSKCDFTMRLLDATMSTDELGTTSSAEFQRALERYRLRFAFHDGRIGDLCPDPNDPVWVLNIKRGILSTFQNTMENLEKDQSRNEVDVTGTCATDYSVSSSERPGIDIHKTKDLANCLNRSDRYSSIQTSPVLGRSGFGTSTPVLKSSHTCRQYIQSGKLQESECSEEHAFQPFSRQDSGATTKNVQSLNLVSEDQTEVPDSKDVVLARKSLLFEHNGKDQERSDAHKAEAKDALKELCHTASNDITPEVPEMFTKVVHRLQKLDHQQLQDIYQNVNDICDGSTKARKFMLDAVSMAGSDAGVTMMTDLISKNEISDSDARNWFLMLGFMPKPTRTMIATLTTLLQPSTSDRHPKAVLGISALIHSYCKKNADCGSQPEVVDFVNRLANNLGSKCETNTDEEKQKTIVTLKALGNVGHFDGVVRVVQQCYQSTSNAIDVRLAAIDAFRRLPCTHERDDLLREFFDHEEDPEVRIASYLASMMCPTSDMLVQVHKSLYTEEVNQVGSFVWTHLTNLNERSHYEFKYDVQKILSSKKLQEKFSTDFRKFSRYYETSAYLDVIRTGFQANGAVVFSPKSYLPRSANLGLELELFGETVDLFEIGGRAEGFEALVESLFGQNGYFHDETIRKMLESARQQKSYSQTKMNEISKIFNMKNAKDTDPMGAFYMRIFGNDLHYFRFRGLDSLFGNMDTLSVMETIFRLAQEEEMTYTKSVLFMDSSLIIPTSVGLPLNLTVNGAATVNVKVGGKIDLSRLATNSLDVAVHLEPSAAIEISGTMMIEGFVSRSGLKIATTMHTSTHSNVEISVENGEVVHARINVPKNQQDIIDIQSKVMIQDGDTERAHKPLVNESMDIERCSSDVISKYLGVQLCGQLQYPLSTANSKTAAPAWILAGPYVTRLYLQKTDTSLKSYNFEYRWDRQTIQTPTASDKGLAIRTGRLSFDTPGSTVDRKLMAEFVHNEAEKSVSINLMAPITKTSFHGKMVDESNRKSLYMNWIVDGFDIVNLKTDLSVEVADGSQKLTPSLLIDYLGRPILALKGHLLRQEGKKYSTQLTVEHLTTYPITVSGVLTSGGRKGSQRYVVDANLDTGLLKSTAKASIQTGNSNTALKGTLTYTLRNGQTNSATVNAKYGGMSNAKGRTWQANCDFRCTMYPSYNWGLNASGQMNGGQADGALTFTYGEDATRDFNKLTVQHKHDFQMAPEVRRYMSTTKVHFPPANIDTSLEFQNEMTSNSIDADLTVQYETNKKINFMLTGRRGGSNDEPEDLVRGLAKLTTPTGRTIKLSGDLKLDEHMEYTTTLSGNWMNSGQDATAILKLKPRPGSTCPFDRQLTAEFTLPGQAPLTLTADVQYNDQHKGFRAEAEMDGKKYRTHAEYHRPSLNNVQIALGAYSPDKTYSGSVHLDNGQNEKSLKTDMELEGLPKLSSDFRFKRDNEATKMSALVSRGPDAYSMNLDYKTVGFEGQIVLSCPKRDLGFSWNETGSIGQDGRQAFRSFYELWWDQDKKMTMDMTGSGRMTLAERNFTADVQIRTPFRGIEELGIRIGHMDDFRKWKSVAIALISGESIGALSSEGDLSLTDDSTRIQANFQVETPFPTMPTFEIDLNHTSTGHRFESDINVRWYPQKQMEFKVHGSSEDGVLNAAVAVKTPFEAIRDASVSGDFFRRDKLTGRVRLARNGNEIVAAIEGNSHFTTDKLESYLKIDTTMPFGKNLSLILSVGLNESSAATMAEFSWASDKKVTLELEASRDSKENVAVTVHVSTPFASWQDVRLNARYAQIDSGTYRTGLDLEYNQRNFHVQFDWVPPSWKRSSFLLEVSEPYGIFERVTFEGHHQRNSDEFVSGVKATWRDKPFAEFSSKFQKTDSKLTGLVELQLPLKSCRKIHAKFAHERDANPRSCRTKIEVGVDDRQATATHVIKYDNPLNFQNNLHVRLPFDTVRDLKLSTTQRASDKTLEHKTGLTIDDVYEYSIEFTSDVTADKRKPQASLKIRSPDWYLIVTGSHDIQNSIAQLDVELPHERKFQLTAKYNFRKRGSGNVKVGLRTPIRDLEDVSARLEFQDKTGSVSVQWRDNRAVQITWKQERMGLEVSVETPFTGYEHNSIKVELDGDLSSKMSADVLGSFQNHTYQIAAKGLREPYSANFEVLLATPFRGGFEKINLAAQYDFRSSNDQSASLRFGSLEASVFLKTRNDATDAGFVMSTPIAGYEHVMLSVHHNTDNVVNISFHKPDFQLDATAAYTSKPEVGLLQISLSNPTIKSLNIEGRYQSNDDDDAAKTAYISLNHNYRKYRLGVDVAGTYRNRRLTVNLKSPATELNIVGQYDVTKPTITARLTVTDQDDRRATLDVTVNSGDGKTDFLVAATSPIPNFRNIKITGNYKATAGVIGGRMAIEKDDQKCELQLMTSLHRPNRGSFRLALKTPFVGYSESEFIVDADLEDPNRKSLAVHARKEDQILDVEAEIQLEDGRWNQLTIVANTTVPDYEHLRGSLAISNRKGQSMYLLTFNRRPEETYKAKLELNADSPGLLESSLLLKTPVEDVMLSGRYSSNDANVVTLDVKAIRQKTMIEFGGRFWHDSNWRKVDGNAIFNTNYQRMIAMSIGGSYDVSSSDRKEIALQSSYNGNRNSIRGKWSLSEDTVDVSIDGNVGSVPAIGTFSSTGSIDYKGGKWMKLTVQHNDKNRAEISGNFIKNSTSVEGNFAVSTSVPGYESLTATTRLVSKYPITKLTASLKSNGKTHLDLVATQVHSRQGLDDLDIVFSSSIPNWESGRVRLTVEDYGRKLGLTGKLNERNVFGNYEFSGDRTAGKFEASWSANVGHHKTDIEVQYNVAGGSFSSRVASNDVPTFSMDLRFPNAENLVFQLNSAATGNVSFQGQYRNANDKTVVIADMTRNDVKLFILAYDFSFLCHRLSVVSNVVGEDVQLILEYDLRQNLKTFSAIYNQGSGSHFRIGGSLDVANKQRREIKFDLKSSVAGFEDIRYETVYDVPTSELTALLQWEQGKAIKLEFSLEPNYSKLTMRMTTPFPGFENLDFVANKNNDESSSSRFASMKFEWQDKKMELTAKCEPNSKELSFGSPFEGFEQMTARVSYTDEPSASLSMSINDQTFDVTTKISRTATGAYLLFQTKTSLPGHELYEIEGTYDRQLGHGQVTLKCHGQQIDVNADVKSENNGQQLLMTLETPFRQFRVFSMEIGHSREGIDRKGRIQVRVNDNVYGVDGNLALDTNSFRAGLQFDSMSTTKFSLDVAGELSSDKFEFKVNVNKKEVEFEILLERHVDSLNGIVQLSSVHSVIPNFSIRAKCDDTRSATLTVHWNDVNTVQSRYEAKRNGDVKFEFNSQISPLGHAHAHVRFHPGPHQATLKALLDVESFGKMTLEVDSNHSLPHSLQATAKLMTSFADLRETFGTISFAMSDTGSTQMDVRFRSPLEYLKSAQLIMSVQNDDDKTKAMTVTLRLNDTEHVMKVTFDGIRGTLLIESPSIRYFTGRTYPYDFKHRPEATSKIGKATFEVTLDIRPGNYVIQASLVATNVPMSPMKLLGKYVTESDSLKELAFGITIADMKHNIQWIRTVDGGRVNIILPYYREADRTLSIDYSSTKPTVEIPFYSFSLDTAFVGYRKCSSSLKITLHEHFRKFSADLQVKAGKNDGQHSFVAGYAINDDTFESHVAMNCRFLPSRTVQMDAVVNRQDANVVLNIGSVRNVVKATYMKASTPIGTYDVSIDLDLPSIYVTNAKLEGRIAFDEDQKSVHGQMVLQHDRYNARGSFNRSDRGFDADLQIGSLSISGRFSSKNDYRKGDAQLVMSGRGGGPQKRALSIDWNLEGLRGKLDYLRNNDKVFGMEGSYVRMEDPDTVDGRLSVHHDGVDHSIQLGWKHGRPTSETNYQFQLKTPLMGIDTLGLRSRLARIYGKHFDGTLTMDLSNSSHSFGAKFDSDPRTAQFEGMANSPYLTSRAYTLTGKVSREISKIIVTFTLANPTERHTAHFEASRTEEGTVVLQMELNTPFLNINELTLTCRIKKLDKREIDVEFRAATTSEANHVLKIQATKGTNSISAHLELDTPLLMSNRFEADVRIDVPSATQLNFKLTTTVAGKPFALTGEVHRQKPDLKIKGAVQTGNNEHGFETHVRRETGIFTGSVQIESDLIPCKKLEISGNYRLTIPDTMDGGLAIATPDKNFKVQTNYRHRSKRSLNGLMEYRAANDQRDPDLGLYLDYQGPQTVTVRVRTSMEDYNDIQAGYSVERKMDGTAVLNVTFGNGRVTYGLDSQILQRPPTIRKGNFVLIWSNERYVIGGEINRKPDSCEARFRMDFPIEGLRGIDYKIEHAVRGPETRTFSSILSGTSFEHSINGEINRNEDNTGVNGHFDVDLPIAGLRATSLKFSHMREGGQLRFTLKQMSRGQAILQVEMLDVYRNGNGNGKMQVSSPFTSLRNADVYYSYETNGDKAVVTANMGCNHNGKNLIEINAKSNDGTVIVEILSLTRPMSIEYTYKTDDNGAKNMAGTYCWNTESRQDSSVGFNAQVKRWGNGIQATITTVHPTRPIGIKYSWERTDKIFKHDVELSWNAQTEAVSYSIEANRNLVMIGFGFPTRKVEMLIQRDVSTSGGLHSTSALLKWDAGRDETKNLGFHVKRQDLSGSDARIERYYQLGLSHPKLEKDLTVSGHFLLDPTSEQLAMARVELDYSNDEKQKFTAEVKILKNSKSTGMDYDLNCSVRHPASELNIETVAVVRDDIEVASGWLQINYLGNGGQTKTFKLSGQILKLLNKIQTQMEAPEMKLHLVGQFSANRDGYLMHLASKFNDQEVPYSADLQLDRKDRRMAALKVMYNPDKKSTMMMRSGMPDKKTISLEIFRTANGKTIEDVKFNVNLNNSRELVTRFHWRPESFEQIESLLPQLARGLCSKTKEIGANLNDYLVDDVRTKYDRFTTSFARAIRPMTTDLSHEIMYIGQDLGRVNKAFGKLYADNVFYFRTFYDIVAPMKIFKRLCELAIGVSNMITDIRQSVVNGLRSVTEGVHRLCEFACEDLVPAVGRRIRDAPYAVLHHVRALHDLSRWTVHQLTMQTVRIFGDLIVYMAEAVHQWKGITPEWIHRVSTETTAKLQAYLDTFFESKYYVQLKSQLEEFGEAIRTVYNQEFWRRAWTSYSDNVRRLMDMFTSHTYSRKACEMARKAYEIGLWAYDFMDIEGIARQLLQMFMVRMEHVAMNTIQKTILPDANLPDVSHDVVFEPEDGKLEIRQRLPLAWTSFDELPQVEGSAEHREFEQLRENFGHLPAAALKNFKQALSDEFTGQSGSLTFRARALLLGDQHYVTFDGRAYEFAGQCTYLLAKDFVDDKFTVIVDYDKSRAIKKSVLMVVDGHQIEIASRTTRVMVDDVPVETPTTVGSAHITRFGNSVSIGSDVRQVWLTYDATHDFLVLEIGGFYHGKTGGLFGSYDHEAFNDQLTPDRSTDADFARTWEVGRDVCPSHENRARSRDENLGPSYEVLMPCEELFGKYASLRSCYQTMNPSTYKNMCVKDVSDSKGPCSAAAAYVAMCRLQGIHVTIPKSCLECDVNGMKIAQDQETVFEGSSVKRTADVVFVVDNTWQCSTTFSNLRTTLATVARNVEGALQAVRVKDNRYGVVGYGGAENRPQVMTAGGQPFAALSQLDKAMDNIHFTSGRHHHLSDLIEYATTELHDFRPTSKKVFVVVPCAEADEDIEAATYDRIAKHVNDMDATVHMISVREPVVREDSKIDPANIIGYDSETAFTLKSAQRGQLVGDDKIRRQMVIQETRLISMTFESNGSVFYAGRLGSVQPSVSRLANEAFGRRIALKAIPAACQNCQCTVTVGSGLPRTVCSKCSNEAVQQMTFNDEQANTSSKNQSSAKSIVRKSSRKKALDEKTRYHKF